MPREGLTHALKLDAHSASARVAAAAVALSMALGVSGGFANPVALLLMTTAAVLALVAAPLPSARAARADTAAAAILALGLTASLALQLLPPKFAAVAARATSFRVGLVACAAILATHAWSDAPRWFRHSRFAAISIVVVLLGAMVIRAEPTPHIDVWHLQRLGTLELLAGNDPYSAQYPNIYGPRTRYLDPSLLSADRRWVTALPYTPLTLLLDVPGILVGDLRWALLAATLASAWLIRALGRGTMVAELAGALLLLQPQGFWALEQAWTEPFALLTSLLAALAVTAARGWLLSGLALGFAASSKQYVPLIVTPLWLSLSSARRWRALAVAAVIVAALFVPFLAWDPAGLIRGVLEFQLRQPFRADALSWPAAVLQAGGPRLPTWPAFPIALAVLAFGAGRAPSPGRALLSGAAAWIAFVAFNKQAFCNYYWLAVGLLCAAVAMTSSGELHGAQH